METINMTTQDIVIIIMMVGLGIVWFGYYNESKRHMLFMLDISNAMNMLIDKQNIQRKNLHFIIEHFCPGSISNFCKSQNITEDELSDFLLIREPNEKGTNIDKSV